jgi:hypothetical protein
MKTEIWSKIDNYEGIYEVSNYGRIKSLSRNILKKGVCTIDESILNGTMSNGYLTVKLSKNGNYETKSIHQLVAIAFLNHFPCKHELVVNHKDFNRKNNHVDNLEIITNRENTNKKHLKSSSKYVGVSWHKKLSKWQARILINGKDKHIGFFDDEKKASEYYELALLSIKNNSEIITYNNFKSKYKGVGWNKANKKWTAQIRINGKQIHLGCFINEIEAHNAYKNKSKEINM